MRIQRTGLATTVALVAALLGVSHAAAATPAEPWDFNGDGWADLAVGIPHEDGNRGAVNVIYGSATGLTATGDDYWTQDSPGIRGTRNVAGRNAGFGARLVSADFDWDGFADVAIASPEYPSEGVYRAGAINVIYGSASGLTEAGDQLLTPASVGADTIEHLLFGDVMTAGDVNSDGFADLVVGLPNASVDGQLYAGEVRVVFGSGTGLSTTNATTLDATMTLPPRVDGWSGYGRCLAVGDFDGDAHGDLVTCAQGAPTGIPHVVDVVYGDGDGLQPATSQVLDNSVAPGALDTLDWNPGNPTVGDFDDDGRDDLALGAPGAWSADRQQEASGAVVTLYGSASGLSTTGVDVWRQETAGIPGVPEELDQFGAALAAGDLDGDGRDDLVVGVPWEKYGTDSRGTITVIPGSASGLTAVGSKNWTEATLGVPDGGLFGERLFVADFGKSARADLALGAPYRTVSSHSGAGAVTVLYGSPTWLTSSGAQRWHQDSAGIKGTAELHDYFGWAIPAS